MQQSPAAPARLQARANLSRSIDRIAGAVKLGLRILSSQTSRFIRRPCLTVASRNVNLTDASLKLLLHLIVARKNRKPVHKIDLGAKTEQGFKGISNLRNELRPLLGGLDIIDNDYQGHYQLKENVTLGECACERLLEIGDQTISRLAKELQHH
jgi:hypothetical protein